MEELKYEIEQIKEWVSMLSTKIDTINKRTKIHTLDIRHIQKELNNNGGKQ